MSRGRGMGVTTEEYLVPANKTGLVIGKGKLFYSTCAVVH